LRNVASDVGVAAYHLVADVLIDLPVK